MGTSTEHSLPHSDNPNWLAPRQLRTILQSWKEIASELDRGVRTVQRWERTLGLPVHRLGKGARRPVFAFKDELHLWFQKKARATDRETIQSPPGEVPADSGSKHHQRPQRSLPGEASLPERTSPERYESKTRASVLQSIDAFFAQECSRHKVDNCRCCHSALRILEGRFSLCGTDMEWRIPIPYCPNCDGETTREFCQFPMIH
jgi:hypothetical protein